MAKLRDIFPKWMLKERSYGDLEVGGGAFTHLAEDTGNSTLTADWSVVAGDPTFGVGPSAWLRTDGQIQAFPLDTDHEAIQVSAWDDGASRLVVKGDGSLHWGDGTDPPDTQMGTHQNWGGAVDGGGGLFVTASGGSPSTDAHVALGTDGAIQLRSKISGDATIEAYPILSGGHSFLRVGYSPGDGIALMSPNGTVHYVTVNNAGALAVA